MKYDNSRNPLSPNYKPAPPPEPRQPGPIEEMVTAVFAGLFAGVAGSLVALAAFGLPALLLYGVAILIFRHAYGVELPNPFSWFGLGWFGH